MMQFLWKELQGEPKDEFTRKEQSFAVRPTRWPSTPKARADSGTKTPHAPNGMGAGRGEGTGGR
eukprot:scaffold33488_cov32-Tisochrysis_lutea.AAC.4